MITGIVFSKDRAMQLRLLLESLELNFPQLEGTDVLYDCSDDSFLEGYKKLQSEYPSVKFFKQSENFYEDIQNILFESKDYICFFTDDDLVYQKIPKSIENLPYIFKVPVSCFSLRIGYNTVLRECDGEIFQDNLPPQGEIRYLFDDIIAWNRTLIPVGGYWSYPLSVDGHIFRKSEISSFLDEIICWNKSSCCNKISNTPNSFESILQRFYFETPPLMVSFTDSVVVNSPNNRVQNDFENAAGEKFSLSQNYLNQKYLDGYVIDIKNINLSNIKCPHQELDLSIKKYEE